MVEYDKEYFTKKKYEFSRLENRFKIISRLLTENLEFQTSLDLGCAKGFLVYFLRESGKDAWGVDISQYAIDDSPEEIREYLFAMDLGKGKLPFPNERFDLVTMLELFEHLDDNAVFNALEEVRRVTKKGGFLYFTSPSSNDKEAQKDPAHINLKSKEEWISIFRKYGFNNVTPEKKSLQWKIKYRETEEAKKRTTPNRLFGKIFHQLGGTGIFLRTVGDFILSSRNRLFFQKN